MSYEWCRFHKKFPGQASRPCLVQTRAIIICDSPHRPPQLARAPASRTLCWFALERPVKNLRLELRCQRPGGRTLVSAVEARLPILDETLCPSTDITVAAGQCIPDVGPRSPVRQEKNDARTPCIFGAARSAFRTLRELNTFRCTKMPGCYHD